MPAAGEVSLFAVQLAFEIFGALDGQAGFALADNHRMNGTTNRSHGLEGASWSRKRIDVFSASRRLALPAAEALAIKLEKTAFSRWSAFRNSSRAC
jgi:hypothetical protein